MFFQRLFFISVFFLIKFNLFSQWNGGLTTGTNITNIYNNNDTKPAIGYHIGFVLDYTNGLHGTIIEPQFVSNNFFWNEEETQVKKKLTYIKLPIKYNYQIPINNNKLILTTGGYISNLLKIVNKSDDLEEQANREPFYNFTNGIIVGAHYEFKPIRLGLEYHTSITPIYSSMGTSLYSYSLLFNLLILW